METGDLTILITFAFYMVMLLSIGLWADRRHGRSYSGFLAADRSLGGWVAAVSAAASSESAWVMLGLSGLGYAKGVAAYWTSIGCVAGFLATALFVIKPLRRDSARFGAITVSDYIESRLGDTSKILRTVSAVVIIFFMMCYVVAQFVGAGKEIGGMGLLSYQSGVVLGALIIAFYVVIGGYAAVCWTDFLQGLLMAGVMIVFPLIALVEAGGPTEVLAQLNREGLGWVPGGEGLKWAAVGFIIGQLGIGLGYLGMPHSIIRYITLRDDREAAKASAITVGWAMLVLFGSATLGIVGRVLIPGLEDPELILPRFTVAFLHPEIAGIVLAAVLAAIMSTADSQLMISATALVHDLWYKLTGRRPDERSMVLKTRIAIAVMAVSAMLIALTGTKVIYTFVLFAWGALGAAFSPVILLCLYWKRFNRWGALASFITGPVVVVAWKLTGLSESLYELVPAIIVSVLSAVVVTIMTGGGKNGNGENDGEIR